LEDEDSEEEVNVGQVKHQLTINKKTRKEHVLRESLGIVQQMKCGEVEGTRIALLTLLVPDRLGGDKEREELEDEDSEEEVNVGQVKHQLTINKKTKLPPS
jgi:hypothetical protein